MRKIRYLDIATDIRTRLADGMFDDGRLPSEAELSETYDASRVTIRKALEALRDEGLIDAQQGLGWFAAGDPLRQRLGRLGTIEAQLTASGVESQRHILELRTVVAPARVRNVLNTERVLRLVRLNLADGRPFALVTVWCPASLGGGLTREQLTHSSFHDLLDVPARPRRPDDRSGRCQPTRVRAARGRDELAGARVRTDHLRHRRTTRCSWPPTCSPGSLTEFSVDLPRTERSIAPSGIRLVE